MSLSLIERAELRAYSIDILADDVAADPECREDVDIVGSLKLDAALLRELVAALRAVGPEEPSR